MTAIKQVELQMPDTVAYKILTAEQMATLEREGRFAGSPDDARDGFIHLSTADQLAGTLDKYFAGQEDLHLAAIDLEAVGDKLKWEPARDALFPHIYGDITLETVIAYSPMAYEPDGSIRLPVAG